VRRVLSIKVLFVLILFVMQATDSIAEKTVLPDINSLELVPLQFNEGQNNNALDLTGNNPEHYNKPKPSSIDWSNHQDILNARDDREYKKIKEYKKYAAISAILIVSAIAMVLLIKLILKASSGDQLSYRILVVTSGIWFFMALAIIEPYEKHLYYGYDDIQKFIYSAVIPLVVIWGMVWIKGTSNGEKNE